LATDGRIMLVRSRGASRLLHLLWVPLLACNGPIPEAMQGAPGSGGRGGAGSGSMTRPPTGPCAKCSPLVKCEVVDGEGVCGDCPEGTTGDGEDCEDVDECALGTDDC